VLFVPEKRPPVITLLELRTKLGWTQGQMAEAFGVKKSAYGYYERGKRRVPAAIIDEVRATYGYQVLQTQDKRTFINRRFERMGLEVPR